MNKRMKRVLSAVLVGILTVSTAQVVHAEDIANEESAVQMVEEQDLLSAVSEIGSGENIETKDVYAGYIPVTIGKSGNEDVDAGIISYNSVNNLKGNGSACGYSQPVTFSGKGTVIMAVVADAGCSSGIEFGIYKDAELNEQVDYTGYAYKGEGATKAFTIPSKGTYYVGLRSIKGYNTTYSYTASVAAVFYSGADRTLKNNTQIAVGQKTAQTNYFAFKATANGYLTAYGDSSAALYKVTLCNSSKKALSGEQYLQYSPTYGVKKGTTYYLRVKANTNSNGGYLFKVSNKAITEKSGSTKAKAVTLPKKKTKKGTIVAGSSQADWYKFTLSSSQNVSITMKGDTNDQLKITIYNKRGTIGTRIFYYNTSSLPLKSVGKWSKGTYYIKVERGNKNSSGWYSLYRK